MEGKGPKGRKGPNRERSNQAKEVNSSLNDISYMVGGLPDFKIDHNLNNLPFKFNDQHINIGKVSYMAGSQNSSKSNWYLDSRTTSHINNNHDIYSEFFPIEATPV